PSLIVFRRALTSLIRDLGLPGRKARAPGLRSVSTSDTHAPMSVAPDVSIVIPVYNEEGILREAVTELLDGLDWVRAGLHAPELTFEVVLAENGSRDRTAELAAH